VTHSETETAVLYKRGFNDGYLLAKHAPELSAQLAEIESTSPRIEGMKDGREEYIIEQNKIKEHDNIIEDRDRGLEIERD
jgi:hypothetical protein